MKNSIIPIRARKTESAGPHSLAARLRQLVVGQPEALDAIVPYVELFESGLAPSGRPAGVFLLLGPTGTGKTRTVEALASALHGSERNILRVDCGEFQLEHEVAKLIGAPPGYLGHRETHPMISQQKLNAVTSDRSGVSIVLFDEIEKAAPSLGRLLLGVLDKAALKLGDNTSVNFERSLIFMTSNLGAREMMRELGERFGFAGAICQSTDARKLHAIGLNAVRRRFSPEFLNRVDRMLTYRPLSGGAFEEILDLQLEALGRHVVDRLGPAAFALSVSAGARAFLLERGTSEAYGARELKRAMHRYLIQPLARIVLDRAVEPGGVLFVDASRSGQELAFSGQNELPWAA